LHRTPEGEESAIHIAQFETYGEGAYHTQVAGGGTRRHPNCADVRPEENLFHMDGKQVFRLALKHGPGFVTRLRAKLPEGFEGLKVVVPHQSSKRALAAHPRVLGVDKEQVVWTIETFGNCVAASIPLTLCEAVRSGRIARGDRVLLFGTGAGLSLGGMLLTY
jgi:3-oxoacyl-[acyl-carrier-protein] synthase-3